ncbi:hypothetical protein D3C81_1078650 [compost metagenome]
MPAVHIRELGGHQLGVGQAGGGVVLGMPRDGTGLGHGGLQAGFLQVGGAGTALALAEVHGHGDAAVVGGFHRFHLAQTHVHIQPALLAAADLGLAGTHGAGLLQQPLGNACQLFEPWQAVVGGGVMGGYDVQCFILVGRIPFTQPGVACPGGVRILCEEPASWPDSRM